MSLLALGSVTEWGIISAVGMVGAGPLRERYYWMVDQDGTVSMMPADIVELTEEQP